MPVCAGSTARTFSLARRNVLCWFALTAIGGGLGLAQSFTPPLPAAGIVRVSTLLDRHPSRRPVAGLRVRGGEPHDGPAPIRRDGELSPERAADLASEVGGIFKLSEAKSHRKIVAFDQAKTRGHKYETGQRFSRKEDAIDRAVSKLDTKIPAKKGTFSYAHLKPTAPAAPATPSKAPASTPPSPAASRAASSQPVSVPATAAQPVGPGQSAGEGRGGVGRAQASAVPVTVKHAFTARSDDELSLAKGAVVYVYPDEVEPGWYFAVGGGGRGLVPSTHIGERIA